MSKDILINEESFTRTKKKLKKILEEKGLKVSLCETSEILANSLGFKNTFEMQRIVFSKVEKISHPPLYEVMPCLPNSSKPSNENIIPDSLLKPYTDNQQGWIDIKPYEKELNIIKRPDLSQLSSLGLSYENIKGNIMVYGLKTSGKDELIKDIIKIFDNHHDNYTSLIMKNPNMNIFNVLDDGRVIHENDINILQSLKKDESETVSRKRFVNPVRKLSYEKSLENLKLNNAKGQYGIFDINEEAIPKEKILTLKNKKNSSFNVHFLIHVIVQNGFQRIEAYNFFDGVQFTLK